MLIENSRDSPATELSSRLMSAFDLFENPIHTHMKRGNRWNSISKRIFFHAFFLLFIRTSEELADTNEEERKKIETALPVCLYFLALQKIKKYYRKLMANNFVLFDETFFAFPLIFNKDFWIISSIFDQKILALK